MPKVATLITYYNEKELLTECLNSVFAQTSPIDEVMIYDDCSSFPAKDYISPSLPVKIIYGQENCGPAFGRNELLKQTECEYVHFHDADDLFHPNWCEMVRETIDTTNADIILTEITSIREGEIISQKVLGLERLNAIGDLVKFGLMGSILPASTTFRREIGLNIGGYRTRDILPQSEDFDFHIRLFATGASFASILEPLIIQRLRSNSHSHKNSTLCWSSALTSIRLLSQELPNKYNNILAESCSRIGSILYSLDDKSQAEEAFNLAKTLGSPQFLGRSSLYKIIARISGQKIAEDVSSLYQSLKKSIW